MHLPPSRLASRPPSFRPGLLGILLFGLVFALAPAALRAQIGITGPLTLVETGGNFASGNLAPAGTAFAQDEIGVAPHAFADVNDATYGNASSWIGAGQNSFIGINLGTTPVLLHRVAFGRDNLGLIPDRTAGLYTLQYTAVPAPSAATPEGDWITLGTLDYPPADPETFPQPWLRRVFQFPQVEATGLRIKVASAADYIAIDEIELYAPPTGIVITGRGPGLALVAEGGTQRAAHNLALASAGATPFAKDSLDTPPHALANLNDGTFGNASSWIAGTENSFVGVSLGATPVPVARVAFGRDNTGAFLDRALAAYTLQYTTVPTPGAATPDSAWITLGTIDYQFPGGLNFAQPALRHEFAFPAIEATGLRLLVSTPADVLAYVAIDEFEIYGPPRLRVAQPADTPRTLTNRIAMWGGNNYGQLNIPADLSPPRFLEVGLYHVATLDASGAYRGLSTVTLVSDPAARTGLLAVGTGYTHNLVIQADGSVAGWGSNAFGEIGTPAVLAGAAVRAVAAGDSLSVALTATGEVVAWGLNNIGQTDVPAGLTGVRAIDAGPSFVLALKNDGTVAAWGRNTAGQTNVPSGLSGVRAIAAGAAHGLALKDDGTVVAWGSNASGETNLPSGLANVKAIAAGWGLSAALREDDTLVLWGNNTAGQLTPPAALADRAFIRSISLGERAGGALYAEPAPLAFGTVAPGGQLVRTFTVTNDGGSPLTLGTPALVGGDAARFTLDASNLPASLAPDTTATFTVTFTRDGPDLAATRLVLPTDDPETPAFVFALSANQPDTTAPVISPPADLSVSTTFSSGAIVTFDFTVADDFDPAPDVTVSHPSGSLFPFGTTPVTITATDYSGNTTTVTFDVTVSIAPLTLLESGGNFAPGNLAPGGTAFAKDEINIAPHAIAALNDGVYGNASSWIAGSLDSFAGISLGATPVTIERIAFGRDNTAGENTRAEGTYTVQFTTVPNPDASTPDADWQTIGIVQNPGALANPARRNLFALHQPVSATGIRLKVLAPVFEAGIDEIELYGPFVAPPPTALELWREEYFETTANTGDAADLADPDDDGIVNLLEYAFGLDPTTPGTLPVAQLADGRFGYAFTQPAGVEGVVYAAEYSTDLAQWFPMTNTATPPDYLFRVALAGNNRLFVRFRITAATSGGGGGDPGSGSATGSGSETGSGSQTGSGSETGSGGSTGSATGSGVGLVSPGGAPHRFLIARGTDSLAAAIINGGTVSDRVINPSRTRAAYAGSFAAQLSGVVRQPGYGPDTDIILGTFEVTRAPGQTGATPAVVRLIPLGTRAPLAAITLEAIPASALARIGRN